MNKMFLLKMVNAVYTVLFLICSLITFLFTLVGFFISHDVYSLFFAMTNDYPQEYMELLEDHLWWDLVEICVCIYYYPCWTFNFFLEINLNITCCVYMLLNQLLDILYFHYTILKMTSWDWYYLVEMFVLSLDVLKDSLVAIPLSIARVHWFFSHLLYAMLASCCEVMVIVFFEDSEWVRSLFDTSFIKNSLRWYLPLFVMIIAALVLMSSSTPSYRYDYLSKMGWLKFFGISLGMMLIVALIYYFW